MTLHLPPDLVDFIESGVSMLVAGRDAELRPLCTRAAGARVEPGGSEVTVFVALPHAKRLLHGFEDNQQIALALSRPIDHRSVQLKGRVLRVRRATAADHQLQQRYLAGLVEQLYCVGVARSVVRRLRITPSVAVRFAVDQCFDQTPGPGAGRALESGVAP